MKLLISQFAFLCLLSPQTKVSAKRVRAKIDLVYFPTTDVPAYISITKYCSGLTVKTPEVDGVENNLFCKPKVCLENDTNCAVGGDIFKPGCCVGDEAYCGSNVTNPTNATRCGEQCPNFPDSCTLKGGVTPPCFDADCFTCKEDGGGYQLFNDVKDTVCFSEGTASTVKGGAYKWAIICGAHTKDFPGAALQNRAIGEIDCFALRSGGGFSDTNLGIVTGFWPCQYLQLLQCGCGPLDMNPFDLPAPTKPCGPGDCAILCDDQPKYIPQLCDNFGKIGGIKWWEGKNPFNESLFTEGVFPAGGLTFNFTQNNCALTFWTSIPLFGWLFDLIFSIFGI